MQAEHKRHPTRRRRHIVARHRIHGATRRRRLRKRPVGPLDAEEHADLTAQERHTPMRRCVQRHVPVLEEQPLLWVHRSRLGRRDPKCACIETLRATHKPAMPDARRLQRRERRHVNRNGQRPPHRRHRTHAVAACAIKPHAHTLVVAPAGPLANHAAHRDTRATMHSCSRARRTGTGTGRGRIA